MTHEHIADALHILTELGFPRAQLNERSALTLLALADLTPAKNWAKAAAPMIGITPIMAWARKHYAAEYAPNTREAFRRNTLHQFRDAGLVLYNPDKLGRAVNSPAAVYQLAPTALALLRTYGKGIWPRKLADYIADQGTLAARYASARNLMQIPVKTGDGEILLLSAGEHSALIRDIITDFAPRFAPGSVLIYAGDTGAKMGFFDRHRLADLGVMVDDHGKMPDVVLHYLSPNWLILVESVTSHGPVDAKRHGELMRLFAGSTAGLVYVTAFPKRSVLARYLAEIAWETEVWVADAPTHLIHFNGVRFLGPYATEQTAQDR